MRDAQQSRPITVIMKSIIIVFVKTWVVFKSLTLESEAE